MPLVARLLRSANSAPPVFFRAAFYDLKGRLLQKHGVYERYLTQEVVKDCWSCDGRGHFRSGQCWSCDGTGYYSRWYHLLIEYSLCGRQFLVPVESSRDLLPTAWPAVSIHGKTSPTPSRFSREALLWLALLCDRSLFLKMWRSRSGDIQGPLTALRYLDVRLSCWQSQSKRAWRSNYEGWLTLLEHDPDDEDAMFTFEELRHYFWEDLSPHYQKGDIPF